jgi:protein TonB
MASQRNQRRLAPRILGGVLALGLLVVFVWFVKTMMAGQSAKSERKVQVITVIQAPPPPPPPPPEQPPPPPPEKTEEQIPKDDPEPPPNDEPAPQQQLGIDAEGSAGGDAFGLAARRGGSDLVGGNGGAIFAWYTNRLKDAVLDRLSHDSQIGTKKFSITVRVWIEPDGRIKEVKLESSTGNRDLDQRIQTALASLSRLSDSPPLEMPQPVSLRIVSRI